MLQIKISGLPQNPQLINQIEYFLVDSNTLIRNGYYRKCVLHLDGQYKKLLPIESPLLLRIKVLRRLCYCTLMFFKVKIIKGEINQGKNQFILQLYLRDYHDNISLLKIQYKKKFYTQEMISLMMKAILFRSQYYQKNQLVSRGLLYFHRINCTIIEQALMDKITFFLCLSGYGSQIQFNCWKQLLLIVNFQVTLKYYLKSLDLYQKNFIIIYKEITLTSLEEIKMTLNYYVINKKNKQTKEIILSLFLIALVYEQLNDFLKYQETIKIMNWVDSNYQPENSIGKLYFQQFFDNSEYIEYIEYALEKAEIFKVLKQALPEEEKSKIPEDEDQLNYYTNMLYEFSEFPKIRRQYYYYDKSQLPFTQELIESETQLEKSQALKINARVQMLYKQQPNENESTTMYRSALMKTKYSDNGLSTRFQTESEGFSQLQSKFHNEENKKNNLIKKILLSKLIMEMQLKNQLNYKNQKIQAEQHNQDLFQQQVDTISFDKILKIQKMFGCIGFRKEPFEHETRLSRKRLKKQQGKSINQLQQLLSIQLQIKAKTEQTQCLEQYNNQRKVNFSSAPNIFQKVHNTHRETKTTVKAQEKSVITNKEFSKEMNSNHKTQDEDQLIREIDIKTKETIKQLMDEKESLIQSKPFSTRRSSQTNTINPNNRSNQSFKKSQSSQKQSQSKKNDNYFINNQSQTNQQDGFTYNSNIC
ncbi:unnamed protein product [Paramecium sonneborni]|uniref:Uncharacterized protein n=1 Tax=Paramecium sonneborni TaxID=65129 RepID=A0A8S1RP64_9CILI|nr:unnamed protein product [Paramecium sonneborni]